MRRDGTANRERILLAAEEVFDAGGAGASTEDVARRAGVGVATVFRHFPTKQDLLEATALRYLAAMQETVQAHSDDADLGQSLASAIATLVAAGPTKVTLLNLLLSDGDGLTEPVTTAVASVRGAVGHLLERAQTVGAARSDVTADDVFVLARALAHIAAPDARHTTGRALDTVLDGLGVTRRARRATTTP